MGPKQSTTHFHSQEITSEDFRDVVCSFLRLVEITETEFISTTQKKKFFFKDSAFNVYKTGDNVNLSS